MGVRENFDVERGGGVLSATCRRCGKVEHNYDSGLGRATIAAWKKRHQHQRGLVAQPDEDAAGDA